MSVAKVYKEDQGRNNTHLFRPGQCELQRRILEIVHHGDRFAVGRHLVLTVTSSPVTFIATHSCTPGVGKTLVLPAPQSQGRTPFVLLATDQ